MDYNLSFDAPLEWHLAGTPEMVKPILSRIGYELGGYDLEERPMGPMLNAIFLRVGGRVAGRFHVEELPGRRARVIVPAGRGDTRPEAWQDVDPDGQRFSLFLITALRDLRTAGFLAGSARFSSNDVLQTARQALDSAEDAPAFAAVGNVLRSALIAPGNEIFRDFMLPPDTARPKTDDARARLTFASKHYLAGKSEQFRDGFESAIGAVWKMASSFLHRKNASREESEALLIQVGSLFEAFSYLVPTRSAP